MNLLQEVQLPSLKEIEIEWARRSLLNFTEYTFTEYQVNWHHRELCKVLDKFINGEIRRLMVFMPPRHGKSELVSRRLPAYILGIQPDSRIIATSYGASLAGRLNRDVQRIIDSDRYSELFPDTTLSSSNIRTLAYNNWLRNSEIFEIVERKGAYIGAGIGGAITGEGFNYGIIDDPIKNKEEAESETYREKVWEWYTSTFYTRQEKDASILITMTRWHDEDLAGKLLKQARQDPNADQWVVVEFPAEKYQESDNDPRKIGESLWKGKYNKETLTKIKASISLREWYSLFQQSPKKQEGNMFKREWFEIVDEAPAGIYPVRYWDFAATKESKKNKDPDWTAGGKIGVKDGIYYILDIQKKRGTPKEIEELTKQVAAIDGKRVKIYMEQEGGASGKQTVDYYTRQVLNEYAAYGVTSTGSKVQRAIPLSGQAEAGNVKLVKGKWNKDFLDEIEDFPDGSHDDQVDSVSGAFNQIYEKAIDMGRLLEEVNKSSDLLCLTEEL